MVIKCFHIKPKGGLTLLKLNRSIAEAEKSFQDILAYVQGDAQQHALHEVERNIFSSLLRLGLNLLVVFLARK